MLIQKEHNKLVLGKSALTRKYKNVFITEEGKENFVDFS